MKNIAIITARGGSKRILNKNIKDFCGKPILEYSIEAALKSGVFEEVMVSTDSVEIADVARKCGAAVPFMRSEKNSDDFATTADVLLEVLKEYKSRGREFEAVCCLYPTAPFITEKKLQDANALLQQETVTSVISVTEYSFPVQRAFLVENGLVRYIDEKNAKKRSQDLSPVYHDCGQFYFVETDALIGEKTLVTKHTAPFIVSSLQVQDIDTLTDWKLAELKFALMKEEDVLHEL